VDYETVYHKHAPKEKFTEHATYQRDHHTIFNQVYKKHQTRQNQAEGTKST
jgi:hypothetical protein